MQPSHLTSSFAAILRRPRTLRRRICVPSGALIQAAFLLAVAILAAWTVLATGAYEARAETNHEPGATPQATLRPLAAYPSVAPATPLPSDPAASEVTPGALADPALAAESPADSTGRFWPRVTLPRVTWPWEKPTATRAATQSARGPAVWQSGTTDSRIVAEHPGRAGLSAATAPAYPTTVQRYPATVYRSTAPWPAGVNGRGTYRVVVPGSAQYVPVTSARPATAAAAVRPVRPVYLGRGLIGQPKLYVEGQPVRNALRFLSP